MGQTGMLPSAQLMEQVGVFTFMELGHHQLMMEAYGFDATDEILEKRLPLK